MGGWVIYDQTQAAAPGDVADVIAEYTGAFNAADVTRAEAVMADDYGFAWNTVALMTRDEPIARFAVLGIAEFEAERIGDLMLAGDGPYYVAEAQRITAPGLLASPVEGISMYTIVEEDGVLKVSLHRFISD